MSQPFPNIVMMAASGQGTNGCWADSCKKDIKVKVQYRPEFGPGAVLQVAEADEVSSIGLSGNCKVPERRVVRINL